MSTCIIKGLTQQERLDEKGNPTGVFDACPGIPRGSCIRLEALPKRTVVFEGKASKTIAPDLSPGKYVIAISKFTPDKVNDFSYSYEFYHECTPEDWQLIKSMKPMHVKVMNTTEGPRWRCQLKPCDFEATSQYDAVCHEYQEHRGIDIVAAARKKAGIPDTKPQLISEDALALKAAEAMTKREEALKD